MTSLFNLASIKTKASIDFRKFQSAEILFQIIYTNKLNNVKTILIVRDFKKNKNSTTNPEFLIIGYFQEELIPVNKEESIKTLELLLNYSEYELLKVGLNLDSINQAANFLKEIEIKEDLAYYKLSSNIFALIRKKGEIKNLWNVELCSKYGIKLEFESFYFIGTKSGNDRIIFNILINTLNHEKINKIHLLEDFYINIDKGKGFRKEYTAVCIKIEKDEKLIKFYFSSFVNFLQKSIMGFVAASVKPQNLMYLILRSAGLNDENINIEGFNKTVEATYSVSILIKNLVIRNPFGLGLVRFYPPKNEYEIFNNFSEQLKKELEGLEEKYCWAVVHVKSNNLFDAYRLGRKIILRSIDFLSSVIRDDYIFNFYCIDSSISYWNRDHATPELIVSTITNINNNLSNENVTIDFQNILEPNYLDINCDILKKIKQITWAESLLLEDIKFGDDIWLLMSSLKWLRKSWYADDINDKVIYIDMAIEFMINGEKVTPIYNDEIKEQIKQKLNEIKCLKCNDVDRILSRISDPSFKIKLHSMIDRLKIQISKNDLILLEKIRYERNEIIHGRRECDMDELEISLAINIVCMMVVKKLYSLKDCQQDEYISRSV